MNINYIYDIYQKNSISLDSLKSYYAFSGISGDFVRNNLFDNESQVIISGSQRFINSALYPGLFVNRQYNYSNLTGSGVFLNGDALKVIGNIHNSFSLLVDFDALCNTKFITGDSNVFVFLENTGDANTKYNLSVGITNGNNIFALFSGLKSGKTEIKSCEIDKKINSKNIFSMYFSPSYCSLANHRILNAFDQNDYLTGSGLMDTAQMLFDHDYSINESNSDLYIGGFPKKYVNFDATGFSGYINNVLYSSGLISDQVNNSIAYSHFQTGSLSINENIPQVAVYNFSGIFLNPTGILSSGITGYSYVPTGNNLSYSSTIPYFLLYESGLMGNITGYKIEYKSQVASGISYNSITSLKNLYNKNFINQYSGKCYNIINSITSNNDLIYNNNSSRFGVN